MQDTQQNIVNAAILVFNEDYSAPLEKVAERAAVTRRTLHRYFKGRDDLLQACEKEMQLSCSTAMLAAFESSPDPLKQLENMLYAGIDCGAKYSFFSKLHHRPEHQHSTQHEECARYDALNARYQAVINQLQDQGIISRHITAEWVYMLFSGIIAATINGDAFGTVARQSLKQFAWFSFSKGIGI